MSSPPKASSPCDVDRVSTPFGAENRRRMVHRFFAEHGAPTVENAWKKVYALLLWTDPTTGLAHCYESDKCQPGKPWYARSLAFHSWLAKQFGTSSLGLKDALDRLFREALELYLKQIEADRIVRLSRGAAARASLKPEEFPLPGADPELEKVIRDALGAYLASSPPPEVWERLGERLREYWRQENKRKNLLGEGFEDVLAGVVGALHPSLQVRARTSVADIRGFYPPGARDKATKVDLVVEHPRWKRPVLINVKWSVRADREDQLWDDFNDYVRFDRDGRGFDHLLITNEFDPARLKALCERRQANSHVFKSVVHISTEALLATYGPFLAKRGRNESSFQAVARNIAEERLVSLGTWLGSLASRKG